MAMFQSMMDGVAAEASYRCILQQWQRDSAGTTQRNTDFHIPSGPNLLKYNLKMVNGVPSNPLNITISHN